MKNNLKVLLGSLILGTAIYNLSNASPEKKPLPLKETKTKNQAHCYCNYLAGTCVASPPHSTAFCGLWAPDCSPYNYECGGGGE